MTKPTDTPTAKTSTQNKGTRRWPAACEVKGQFILLPKVLLRRFGELDISPQHLLLLLALQAERYGNRTPRFYWEELAEWFGRDRNTVRKWGYELKGKKLLKVKTNRKLNEGEARRVGHRNERNEFHLESFINRVEGIQAKHDKQREERRTSRREAAGDKP